MKKSEILSCWCIPLRVRRSRASVFNNVSGGDAAAKAYNPDLGITQAEGARHIAEARDPSEALFVAEGERLREVGLLAPLCRWSLKAPR